MARGFGTGCAGGGGGSQKKNIIYNEGSWNYGFENPGTAHETVGDNTTSCDLSGNKITVGPSNNNSVMALICTTLIDMSRYTTLHIRCKSITNVGIYGGATAYVSTSKTDIYNNKYSTANISTTSEHEIALDISGLSSGYVAFTSNGLRCAEVYEIWMS